MTIEDWLRETTATFTAKKVESARLDALLLLEHVLQTTRATLLAHPEMNLPATTLVKLNSARTQRLEGIPLAYIVNKKEFYGRDYLVNAHVLIPRPETESIIDLAKKLQFEVPRFLDIGTGSGCIAITLALEIPHSKVTATDISVEALEIAKQNAKSLGARITFKHTEMLSGLAHNAFDVICANLPYVPDDLITSPEITKEPTLALFSGKDGLNHYRRLFTALKDFDTQYVITESLKLQHQAITELAHTAGYRLTSTELLIQCFEKITV